MAKRSRGGNGHAKGLRTSGHGVGPNHNVGSGDEYVPLSAVRCESRSEKNNGGVVARCGPLGGFCTRECCKYGECTA